ncbi:helix-turn-helix transcriptional regulator [Flammeovirga sp. MY04]|uniref:helix-turn-helix domain-containing protein n=1 Tax=Flammeovirga sp. MY04 TaxID=1191459 RepID=UPI0008064447|nr:AraC family transcriptional regulator [Flammeovirga sp. MY04]ANQ51913.1 helix-turn-helix transcriptional regulator [Flammeovirga sp. MY04]
MNHSIKTFKVEEGSAKNYFKGLYDALGGTYTEETYSIKDRSTSIEMSAHELIDGLELILADAKFGAPLIMERSPDHDPDLIHIYIVYRGSANQNYNNQLQLLEAGSINGLFIYNGLFPTVTYFPIASFYKSISFKVSKNVFLKLFPHHADTLIDTLIQEIPIAYHTALPIHMESTIDDLLHYDQSPFERIPMLMSKGLELFSQIILSLDELRQKNELNGLHQDDYKRLLDIKNYILSRLHDKIVVDDIATTFGISTSKLKRDFKTLFNTSIYQYYTHAKMDEAYRRLKTGKFSVMEVGYDLGYTSIPNFSAMFKKIKGINPKDVIPQ